jgi:hypothetical protein
MEGGNNVQGSGHLWFREVNGDSFVNAGDGTILMKGHRDFGVHSTPGGLVYHPFVHARHAYNARPVNIVDINVTHLTVGLINERLALGSVVLA